MSANSNSSKLSMEQTRREVMSKIELLVTRSSAHVTARKVLLVDDNPISVRIMEACLRHEGCEIVTVTSGIEALKAYATKAFDLIVLDWQMPDLDGAETLKQLQMLIEMDPARNTSSHLMPVLTYSTHNIDSDIFPNCNSFAFIGHLSKSEAYLDLREKVAEMLGEI